MATTSLLRASWTTALLLVAVCLAGSSQQASAQYTSIIEAITNTSSLTQFNTLLTSAGLVPPLNTSDFNGTVFAPTNAAFNTTLSQLNLQDQLTANNPILVQLLSYHLVPTVYTAGQVASLNNGFIIVDTLANGSSLFNPQLRLANSASNGSFVVNSTGSDAVVTTADITAGNGVMHIIDHVLLPFYISVAQAATKSGLFTFVDALTQSNLLGQFSDTNLIVTVFAPTDEAWALTLSNLGYTTFELYSDSTLIQNILLNHVVATQAYTSAQLSNGEALKPMLSNSSLVVLKNDTSIQIQALGSTANVVQADISVLAGRSYVHIIDNVLLPFYVSVQAAAAATPQLSTLVGAIEAENITTFSDPTLEATVFAPNNDAFNTLLSNLSLTLDDLLSHQDALTTILNYHVVPGSVVLSSQITNGMQFTTANGLVLNATNNESGIYIIGENSAAKIVQANILVSGDRSVIHIIDTVLLPNVSALNLTGAAANAAPSLVTMLAALLGALGLLLFSQP